jgi:four helix bundle protein
MATIRQFEDIEAWQVARELTRAIYACSNSGPFARDFGLRDQIRRASVSIMSNIAEGFERGGSAEFVQFLAIAKGSAGEVEAQLYVAFDQGYITDEQFEALRQLTASTKKLIAGFMNYLKKSDLRGQKYKP